MFSWFRKPFVIKDKSKQYVERGPHVLICVITKDQVEPECMESLLNQDHPDYSIMVHFLKSRTSSSNSSKNGIHNMIRNRNLVRQMALASDAEYFLLVDSDIIMPTNGLSNLIQHKKDFIGGWYQTKGINPRWVASMHLDNAMYPFESPQPSVIGVSSTGLGCALLSRSLLEAVRFKDGTSNYVQLRKGNSAAVAFIDDSTQFCIDVASAGYNCYMDGDTICEHICRPEETSYLATEPAPQSDIIIEMN